MLRPRILCEFRSNGSWPESLPLRLDLEGIWLQEPADVADNLTSIDEDPTAIAGQQGLHVPEKAESFLSRNFCGITRTRVTCA